MATGADRRAAAAPEYLALREAAQRFGVSVWILDAWIKDGRLTAFRFSASPRGKRYVRPSQLAKVLAAEARPA